MVHLQHRRDPLPCFRSFCPFFNKQICVCSDNRAQPQPVTMKTSAPLVVNESVFGQGDAVASELCAEAIIEIVKSCKAKTFIKCSNVLKHFSRHQHTEATDIRHLLAAESM